MKRTKLDAQALEYAVTGGCILGGGGGGGMAKGRRAGRVAVEYTDLWLWDIGEFDDADTLVCASMVGAPKAVEQYQTPQQAVRAMELFQQNSSAKIAGIITNENGGGSSINGWIQAAMLGIPLVDAPCNGRAHPTGVMGSLNLHKQSDYIQPQTAVGGNPTTGRYVECVVKGSVEHNAKLVRMASVEAGGIVAVVRNPVTVGYAKQHCAIGGLSHAIETGKVFLEALETSPAHAVESVTKFLGGKVLAKDKVADFRIKTEGGFDVGAANIGDMELTFWNEYMTLDQGGKRVATFPDLIMSFRADTGMPMTTAEMEQGQEVYVISVPVKNLKVSTTMAERDLIAQVEDIVGKEMVKYCDRSAQ